MTNQTPNLTPLEGWTARLHLYTGSHGQAIIEASLEKNGEFSYKYICLYMVSRLDMKTRFTIKSPKIIRGEGPEITVALGDGEQAKCEEVVLKDSPGLQCQFSN